MSIEGLDAARKCSPVVTVIQGSDAQVNFRCRHRSRAGAADMLRKRICEPLAKLK